MWEMSDSLLVYTATGPLNMLLRIQAAVCPTHRPMATWTDPCRDISSSEILGIKLKSSQMAFEYTETCCLHSWG